jgi:UDP-N-acetylmuramoyl-tripeptide--D-alanyl-D-alanine ligase
MPTPIPTNAARFTPWEVARATGGRLVHLLDDRESVGVTADTRAVQPGCLFVALVGERLDGHAFVADALARGAVAVVVRDGHGSGLPANVVEVQDTLVAWGDLARAHLERWRRGHASSSVVCITGSAGKTTTRLLTAALLAERRSVVASLGNLNNRVGLPAMAFTADASRDAAVFEVGMSLRGEIAQLASIARPDVGVLLNCGVAHAEGVGGTRSDVAREKGALLEALPASGVAIVNGDDHAALGQIVRTVASPVRFGKGAGNDVRLVLREPHASGARLTISNRGRQLQVDLPLAGEAAAIDCLAALAAAEAIAGPLADDEIAHALATVQAMEGRARIHRAGTVQLIDDAYNANPSSMSASLQMVVEVAKGARIGLVLGDMKELGPLSAESHRELAECIRHTRAGWIILCGQAVRHTYDRLEELGIHAQCVPDAEAALVAAQRWIESGDVVLVKGSRSLGLERVVSGLASGGAT